MMGNHMRLLLISNSTNAGEPYLEHPLQRIGSFLQGVKEVLFVPFAGVSFTWDEYEAKVGKRFSELGIQVHSVHRDEDVEKAVHNAEAIVVGGGNTWQLIDEMQKRGLLPLIRAKVLAGTPYVGWSAGSNVACPTIKTTNDMPIVEPQNFGALNLIPFQINPHYLDANPEGHAGETREDRIEEFIIANKGMYVAGLREGSILSLEKGKLTLEGGNRSMRVFRYGDTAREVNPGDDLGFLL